MWEFYACCEDSRSCRFNGTVIIAFNAKIANAMSIIFTILSPLVLYKGPFNLQGMGAGLSAVIISSTSMNPMVLGMALLSLNNLRK